MNMEILHEPKFWVIAAFIVFILLAYKKAATLLINTLDSRSAKIKDELEQASSLRAEAETVLAEYKQKQAEYIKEAEYILEKARKDADAFNATAEKDLKAMLDIRTKAALERISKEEESAIADVQDHIVDIALSAARVIITENSNDDTQDELIKLALSDIEHKIH